MSDNKIMPWIDELEGAAATNFPARRDEIAAMMAEAAELVRKGVLRRVLPGRPGQGPLVDGSRRAGQAPGRLVRAHGPVGDGRATEDAKKEYCVSRGEIEGGPRWRNAPE
jgi:hypothetical protein